MMQTLAPEAACTIAHAKILSSKLQAGSLARGKWEGYNKGYLRAYACAGVSMAFLRSDFASHNPLSDFQDCRRFLSSSLC